MEIEKDDKINEQHRENITKESTKTVYDLESNYQIINQSTKKKQTKNERKVSLFLATRTFPN